jgi:hypothetical protein
MFNSIHRIKKQWKEIRVMIDNRQDIIPFAYAKNMKIVVNDEVFPIRNKRDFHQHMSMIYGKYGMDADFGLKYQLNYNLLVKHVENKSKELFGETKKSGE